MHDRLSSFEKAILRKIHTGERVALSSMHRVRLEFAGAMQRFPQFPGAAISGGDVYRITNPDDFYQANGAFTICERPPQFLVTKLFVARDSHQSAVGGDLWLLDVDDYREFDPGRTTVCVLLRYHTH